MSNLSHHPATSGWQHNALQLVTSQQWEAALTLWVEQAEFRTLSLWLLQRLGETEQIACATLHDAMQRWYAAPEEKLRWEIFHRAEKLGFDRPVSVLALALFWSQGSMSPEGLEPIYPEPHLSKQMCRCALLMLATQNSDNPAEGTARLLAQWTDQERT